MKYDSHIHNRHSMRLSDYDYSQAGYYFVTICVYNRQNMFGKIENEKMILNEPGIMAEKIWKEIPLYYQGIQIDEFVIMPNHIHGIIIINDDVGAGPCARPIMQNGHPPASTTGRPQGAAPTKRLSLPDIIQRYKSLTTKNYIDGVINNNWPPFDKHLWQRNYYDHIIRDDISLNKIREYIIANPAMWDSDEENPANLK